MSIAYETNVETADLIGARLINSYGTEGFVYRVENAPGNVSVIGASGLVRCRFDYLVCWEKGDGSYTEALRDQIAAPMLARASHLEPVTDEAERSAKVAHARECMQAAADARKAAQEAASIRQAEFKEECKRRVPSWAKAVIIARLDQDKSDGMTDYFATTTRKTVILGFSKHTRDLFPELRKMARNYQETAHLADAGEEAEHREKYSMGRGYYLKASNRYSDGWSISKEKFYGDREPWDCVAYADEWATEAPQPVAAPAPSPAPSGVRIETHTHTKKGFEMHICILPERVDRAEFDRLNAAARALKGWYSRPWNGTPGGFAFKDRSAAETFAGSGAPAPAQEDRAAPAGNQALADRFRELADNLQADIDHKFSDRRTNTPKQARDAGNARNEGRHLERTQKALRALAALQEAGEVPAELSSLKSKKAIHDLTASRIDHSGGYYDAGRDTGEPRHDTPATRALWALLGTDEKALKAEATRQKLEGLKFLKIAGYFPTPAAVVSRMLDYADIQPGATVLEPEAGSAAIADAVKEAVPSAELVLFEVSPQLREVLGLKGYDTNAIGSDFLEADLSVMKPVDRVLMNPPFERGQDMDHVKHAFQALKPGGRLVAIMSPGFTFRQDAKARGFRAWLEAQGGEIVEELPAGTFKDSGTGVATVMLVIDREA